MLFASTSLAARIERAECRLLVDGAEAVARRRPEDGVLVLPIAGGVATFAGKDSPLNKVAGLGFGGVVAAGELDALERAFAARGAAVRVELACLAEAGLGALLTRRGYVLEGFENVLGRRLPTEGPPRSSEGIEVGVSGVDELSTWLDVLVTGFANPDTQGVPSDESFPRETVERVLSDMAAAKGFVHYLARLEGTPAGAGSMRMGEGVAQLCGAATLPALRRRGVQTALLAARLEMAGRAGCDVAVVTTQPGSKSQENVQRRGFDLLYTRAMLVRQG